MSSGVRTPPPPIIAILRISSGQFESDPLRAGKATDAAGLFGGYSHAKIPGSQASQRRLAPQPEVKKTGVKAIAGSRGIDCLDRTGFDLEDVAVPQKGRAIRPKLQRDPACARRCHPATQPRGILFSCHPLPLHFVRENYID